MWGSATLAMVVSSTSMKAASATVMAISQGLTRGFHAACASTKAVDGWLSPLAPGRVCSVSGKKYSPAAI